MFGSEKSPFYKAPTADQIQEHGPVVAEARQDYKARRTGSRIASVILAFSLGAVNLATLDVFTSGDVNYKSIIAAFATPIPFLTISQIKNERTQRRDLMHETESAHKLIDEYESRYKVLQDIIIEAGLTLPDQNGGTEL